MVVRTPPRHELGLGRGVSRSQIASVTIASVPQSNPHRHAPRCTDTLYASDVAYKMPSTSKVLVVALGPMACVRAPEITVDLSGIPAPAPFALALATEIPRLSVEISEVSSGSADVLLRHARGNSYGRHA